MRDLKFTEPTPIQLLAIPPALAGHDVLASAETGSGKSAAFGLAAASAADGPAAAARPARSILAPTRELADQIAKHLTLLAKHTRVQVAAVYGGVGFGPQADAFKRGTDIIVATPGRLLDHIAQETARARQRRVSSCSTKPTGCSTWAFCPTCAAIHAALPTKRQTLFFSATTAAADRRRSCAKCCAIPCASNSRAEGRAAVHHASQTRLCGPQESKTDLLVELLKDNAIYSAIAFTRTKARANRLAAALAQASTSRSTASTATARKRSARARCTTSNAASFRVLVATDIAARGIDIARTRARHQLRRAAACPKTTCIASDARRAPKPTGDAITFVSTDEEP